MEKRYNAELNFQNTTIDLFQVTREEILATIKLKVDDGEILTSIKWEAV